VTDVLTATLLSVGSLFTLLAAVGVVRMPDLFTRMQTASKATTLGVASIVLASAVHFRDLGTSVRALLITVFLFLTAPVAAHAIARAAHLLGVPLWEGTVVDELRARSRPPPVGRPAAPPPEEHTPVGSVQ
jgi:multicomponent Na+:H+ antiporter subunit G